MSIVPAYSVLFALLFVVLSVLTIKARRGAKVALGTGRDKILERAVRVHANFAEYVPFTLLLLSFAELRGGHPLLIHALCAVFLLGRLLHAWGVSQVEENFTFRVSGMMMTFGTLIATALTLAMSYRV